MRIEFEQKNNLIRKKNNNPLVRSAYCIIRLLYSIRRVFRHASVGRESDYRVSICAIFKNEARYLREWIEYHQLVGIDHFYLYNNNSTDSYEKCLKEYVDNGLVTLIDWPYEHAQMECYKKCIKEYSNQTQWMGFIDIDEFIVPIKDDNVYDFLKKYERKQGAVKIYWKMFGSSGKISRDDGKTVVESFVVSWPKPYNVGKCFYNTSYGFNDKSTHNGNLHHLLWASYKGKDFPPVDVWGKTCVGETYYIPNKPLPIQINHYFTKSLQEYSDKKNKGDVYFEINPHDDEYFYSHEKMCTSVDYSAYKYLIELKKRLNSKT